VAHLVGEYAAELPSLTAAQRLSKDGVTVVRMLSEAGLNEFRRVFNESILTFPEFKPEILEKAVTSTTGVELVGGGFGALGNTSSFHCEFARRARLYAHPFAIALLANYDLYDPSQLGAPRRWLEQLFDRMMYRPVGKKPTAESVHRDQSPSQDQADVCFGGWLNLSTNTQHFSCVPGTHRDPRGPDGFAKITGDEAKRLKARMVSVAVPPGHWICFVQHIAHEVLGTAHDTIQKRLFLAFRLSTTGKQLFPETNAIVDNLHRPKLPSGQDPPMYPQMYWVNHIDKLEKWSKETFVDPMFVQRKRKSRAGTEIRRVVTQYTPPLLWPPSGAGFEYSDDDRDILRPKKWWQMPTPLDGTLDHEHRLTLYFADAAPDHGWREDQWVQVAPQL
jgi:hypothetical protein